MARAKTLTAADLDAFQRALRYDAKAGKIFRRRGGSEVKIDEIGRACALNQRVLAARLAWAFSYGKWPEGNVYAKDSDSTNIRLANLRLRDETRYVELGSLVTTPRTRYAYGLWARYKITRAEYEELARKQGDCCAICKDPEVSMTATGRRMMLHVDHDHTTGKVRELLCSKCNSMVGFAREDEYLLQAAIVYLKKHKRPKLTILVTEK